MSPADIATEMGLKAPTADMIGTAVVMAVIAFGLAISYKKAGTEPPHTIQQIVGGIDLCETALEPAVRRLACGKG